MCGADSVGIKCCSWMPITAREPEAPRAARPAEIRVLEVARHAWENVRKDPVVIVLMELGSSSQVPLTD